MEFIVLCLVSVLAVTGAYTLLFYITRLSYKKIPEHIIVHSRDFENEPEYFIRSLIKYFPDTSVTIIHDSKKPDIDTILAMLLCQYDCLSVRLP